MLGANIPRVGAQEKNKRAFFHHRLGNIIAVKERKDETETDKTERNAGDEDETKRIEEEAGEEEEEEEETEEEEEERVEEAEE